MTLSQSGMDIPANLNIAYWVHKSKKLLYTGFDIFVRSKVTASRATVHPLLRMRANGLCRSRVLLSSTATMALYDRRTITSLNDLRTGEHIMIDNVLRRITIWPFASSPSQGTSRSSSSWSSSLSFSSSEGTSLDNGHHMLVVGPLSTESVQVIHMAESGVKNKKFYSTRRTWLF